MRFSHTIKQHNITSSLDNDQTTSDLVCLNSRWLVVVCCGWVSIHQYWNRNRTLTLASLCKRIRMLRHIDIRYDSVQHVNNFDTWWKLWMFIEQIFVLSCNQDIKQITHHVRANTVLTGPCGVRFRPQPNALCTSKYFVGNPGQSANSTQYWSVF